MILAERWSSRISLFDSDPSYLQTEGKYGEISSRHLTVSLLLTYFTPCYIVCIINFEYVIADWVKSAFINPFLVNVPSVYPLKAFGFLVFSGRIN